jgi:hypothetical protein
MTRLGKRLLIALNAPDRPQEGVALISDAAQLGNAEAATQLAVLSAVGMFMPQNWDESRDECDCVRRPSAAGRPRVPAPCPIGGSRARGASRRRRVDRPRVSAPARRDRPTPRLAFAREKRRDVATNRL